MIEFALITSFKIIGIHVCCWQGMIFGWIRPLLYRLPEWLKKPLYLCEICMSSIWGIIFWVVEYQNISLDIIWFILTVCGINSIISAVLSHSPYSIENQDI